MVSLQCIVEYSDAVFLKVAYIMLVKLTHQFALVLPPNRHKCECNWINCYSLHQISMCVYNDASDLDVEW